MTDEQDAIPPSSESPSTPDDKRFEVKWKKRGDASSSSSGAPGDVQIEARADTSSLEAELEAERQRVRDLQDRLSRAQADLVNFRRRTEQERGDIEKFASMLLVQAMLPVLDNFDRALTTIPGNLQMLTWIQGIMLIERHLRAILEQQGVTPIEAKGQAFNTYYHEAIAERETAEAAPGTVMQEMQKGYIMHGRVIRPALVEVAKAPEAVTQGTPVVPPVPEDGDEGSATAAAVKDEADTENTGP